MMMAGQNVTVIAIVSLVRGIAIAASLLGGAAPAADLYQPNNWSNLAVDRVARGIGDSITILIFENAVATNATGNGASRRSRHGGRVGFGRSFDQTAQLTLDNGFEGDSQTRRSGQMVAQISAVVDAVLPNGDLRISGTQILHINSERTTIAVRGRVRREDITTENSVLSSRLAEAEINYDGRGFVSRGAKPGIITRLFALLGLS